MALRHPQVEAWEDRVKQVLDEIDARLEQRHGHLFELHPMRPEAGATANPEDDGLFDVGAAFTAGFGSRLGRGYVVDVRLATLAPVPAALQETIGAEVADQLRAGLARAFPGRELRVDRDGSQYKITGDLSLDKPAE